MPKDAFEYQAPTPEQTQSIIQIRAMMKNLRDAITATPMSPREKALAITKLEECSMWANKGIVFAE